MRVSQFVLPELDTKSRASWLRQREAWKSLAEECLYGRAPDEVPIRATVIAREALWDGRGSRERVRIAYGPRFAWSFDVDIYAPARPGRHPAVTWNQFSNQEWDECPYEEIVAERCYIVAVFEREQIVEDKKDGRNPARDAFPGYGWGAVRAWAWAQSRVADYLLTREDVDGDKLCCTGFSRGGKAALACGVFDERYRVVAPICSGAGGCGCFRYLGDKNGICQSPEVVESLGRVGSVFPHWWTKCFAKWWPQPDPTRMGMEQDFPLDAHVLKALVAPRALFSVEGIDDAWSNPRGTALTWRAAQPVFDLMGGENVAYFRPGGHAFTADDWRALLGFCDHVFYGKDAEGLMDTCPF